MIFVQYSPVNGLGVFAKQHILFGTMVEAGPVIILEPEEFRLVERTGLSKYLFDWCVSGNAALVLGYGSLFNHSYEPNITASENLEDGTMEFLATRDIAKGEELFIDYTSGNPDRELWFNPATKDLAENPIENLTENLQPSM